MIPQEEEALTDTQASRSIHNSRKFFYFFEIKK